MARKNRSALSGRLGDHLLLRAFRGHPGRMIAAAFALAILVGSLLLRLPVARSGLGGASWIDAVFTSTSAVCVTGLVTVDTGSYWSTFGEVVILVLIQAGGLGIMTLATLVALLLSGRFSLRSRLVAQAETKSMRLKDVRKTIRNVIIFSLAFELVTAIILTIRFATERSLGTAIYHGVFHAVSAFNNAGFGLYPDSLVGYAGDPWVCLPVAVAVIVGGLGVPVVFELARNWRRPRSWSILTRLTVGVTVVLLGGGAVTLTAAEWTNPATLGPMDLPQKVLAGFFTGVMPRTAGFNSVDVAAMTSESWLITDLLMFIGGGSAGTAGGIKVTTFGLLALVIWSEMRGEPSVTMGYRRVPGTNQRQAMAVALLGIALVTVGTFGLLAVSEFGFERLIFEAISAFATVGLSTGVTADLPTTGHILLIMLMYVGRIGPLTLFAALAARERTRRYELPEEGTLVG